MNLIYGIVNKSGQAVDTEVLTAMRDAIYCWQPDNETLFVDNEVGFGQLIRRVESSQYKFDDRYTNEHRDLTIVFDGRIDNRLELAHRLGVPTLHLYRYRDEDLVVQAYLRWQKCCCQYLVGDFVFAIWSSNSEELFVARDHLGVRPLFVSENAESFAFASNQKALLALPWVDKTNNRQWIADLLCITFADSKSTFYQGIEVFPAAHWQSVMAIGKSEQMPKSQYPCGARRYWRLQTGQELNLPSDEAYIEQFRHLLTDAVAARLRSTYPIASELSGGLDSTTVSSVASHLLRQRGGHPLIACSHVLAQEHEGVYFPYQDEKAWIKDLCEFAYIDRRITLTASDRGIMRALDSSARHHGGPAREDINRFGDETFEVLSGEGARVLLSGFGGDQLVSSHAYGVFEELMRQKHFSEVWRELLRKNDLYHGIRSYLWMIAKWKMPGVYENFLRLRQSQPWIRKAWQEHLQLLYVSPDFALESGFPSRFFSAPILERRGSVRHRERTLVEHPALQFRLLDSAVGAQAAGVEYRYPLLDIRLLEFCLALPLAQKFRNGYSRRMIRVATEGILPESIRWRQDKSRSTIPTMHARRCRDKGKLCERLNTFDDMSFYTNFVNLEKMKSYAGRLHKDFRRARDGIPRAFDHAYQVLYCLSNEIGK